MRTTAVICIAIGVSTISAPANARQDKSPAPSAASLDERLETLLGRPGGLTADEAAKRAAATSFEVRAKAADLDAAVAGVNQAIVAFFPRLSATARYTRLSNLEQSLGPIVVAPTSPEGPLPPNAPLVSAKLPLPSIDNQYTLSASVGLPISDYLLRIPQAYAAATQARDAAQLSERAQQLKTATDARVAFYVYVRARLQEVVAEQALEQARGHRKDAAALFEAGTASKADVLRVDAQVAQAELLVARARDAVAYTHEQLRTVMHETGAGAAPFAIGEDVRRELPERAIDLESLTRSAATRRLELRAIGASATAQTAQARASVSAILPRLDGFADVQYSNPNPRVFPPQDRWQSTWDAGVQLTFSPNDMAAGAMQHRAAVARAANLQAARAALADGVRVEVLQAMQALRDADAALRTSQAGLAASEESYRVRLQLFRNGRATSVELTDAETELTRARLEAVGARVDLRIARARLAHAAGEDVSSKEVRSGSD
jgi:outer membrane protein